MLHTDATTHQRCVRHAVALVHHQLGIGDVDISYDWSNKPKWNGKRWEYNGKEYRSLRQLKTKSILKAIKPITKQLAEEMRKEIDEQIMKMLIGEPL